MEKSNKTRYAENNFIHSWEESFRVALDYSRQLYFTYYIYIYIYELQHHTFKRPDENLT